MSRSVTAVMRFQADFSDLDASLDAKIRQITKSPVGVPVSSGFGGPLGGSGPTSTLSGAILPGGGVPASAAFGFSGAGAAGASSPNLSFFTGQLTRDVAAAITQAIGEATRTATRGAGLGGGRGSGLISFQGEELTREQYAARGADLRSAAFARAAQWNRVDTAVARAKLSQNLARTAGTYSDPGAALDEAISEGAAMEEAAYPGAIAAANARRGGGAAGVVGLGLLGRGPFRRIGGRFAAAYGIYAGIQAVEAGIRGAQGVSLADQFGGAEEQIAARQRAYEGVMNAVPIIGPFSDALAGLIPGGGSAEFEKQKAEERRAAARTTAFIERGNEGYRSIARTAEINEQTSAVGVRNPFAQRFQEIRTERSASERAFDLRQHELEGAVVFAKAHGSDNDIAIAQSRLDAFGANRGREEAALSRLFGAKSRDTERDYDLALRSVEQQTRGFTHAARITELERQRNPNGTRDENAYVNGLEQLENTHFGWERSDVRLEQSTRRAEIAAGMERNPLAAETAGIVGATRQRFRNLMRTEKPEEADEELKLGIAQLQLTQRDALLSFRGVTLPSQNFETRDLTQRNADFGEQLKSVDDGIKDLVRLLTTLVED